MEKKKILFIVACLFLIITTLGIIYYRPYIYTHQYFDFYIADACKGLFGIPGIALFYLSLNKNSKPVPVILTGALVFIAWDMIEFVAGSAFNYKAIIGTVIGSILSWVIYKCIMSTANNVH